MPARLNITDAERKLRNKRAVAKWQKANAEQHRQACRRWRLMNRAKSRASSKAWKDRNRERMIAVSAIWQKANIERCQDRRKKRKVEKAFLAWARTLAANRESA